METRCFSTPIGPSRSDLYDLEVLKHCFEALTKISRVVCEKDAKVVHIWGWCISGVMTLFKVYNTSYFRLTYLILI